MIDSTNGQCAFTDFVALGYAGVRLNYRRYVYLFVCRLSVRLSHSGTDSKPMSI